LAFKNTIIPETMHHNIFAIGCINATRVEHSSENNDYECANTGEYARWASLLIIRACN
jgi:hypothetical protein